jgi:hypothetical protein
LRRSKKLSPIHHLNAAGKRREVMGTEGNKNNPLGIPPTSQTTDGSEVFAKIEGASSQAGRRRFDPGRPLHVFLLVFNNLEGRAKLAPVASAHQHANNTQNRRSFVPIREYFLALSPSQRSRKTRPRAEMRRAYSATHGSSRSARHA